jgi:hypothetical protein
LKRLTPTLAVNKVIPSHQFGFRPKHGIIQQVYRIIHRINNDQENKRYCTAAFLDISQAFDKVWHTGLFLKLKQALPHREYTLLRSYLMNRMFQVCHQEEYTMLHPIHAGVTQGSILGPILYTIFKADLPEAEQTLTATYADNTAILAPHEDPIVATSNLQTHMHRLEHWLQQWPICTNESKSTQVTFTLRQEECLPIYLNGRPIPQNDAVKYLGLHHMENAHSCQNETIRPLIQTYALDHWQKLGAIACKQTSTIQNNTKTYLDIRNSPLGHSLPIQHRNLAKLSKQSITNNSECTVVCTQQHPTRRSAHTNRPRSHEAQRRPQG